MSEDRFARIEALFNAAMEQAPDARLAFVAGSAEAEDVRATVLRMLDQQQTADHDPVGERLARVLPSPASAPASIGPYRIAGKLGEGGMGTVFLAERQVQDTTRRVALKLLQGVPTDAGRRRMARERALLGGLNHPHIARLIDSGESEDGRPYLVMDYVEGEPLSAYLTTRKPSLDQRLQLFLECCDAVQHAHQHLVLHRDIKPSNIVVGEDGTPVLLDFGIGTLLEEGDSAAHTATLAFTPGYAAPEQLHGEAATTATDVFGLGALLFEILTDTRLSTVRKGDAPVPVPSSQTTTATSRRELRGDLDRIVLKATATDPAERYATVAALADDIRRYLRGEPILAAPDAVSYRLRKFVRRHRWAVAAGMAVLAMVVAFVWRLDAERDRALMAEQVAEQSARDAKREARNAGAARDFLSSVLGEASPSEATQFKPITVDSLMASAIRKLNSDKQADPHTRAAAWVAIASVYGSINNPPLELAAAEAGSAYLRLLPEPDLQLMQAVAARRISALGELDRYPEALAVAQDLVALNTRHKVDADEMASAYYGLAVAQDRADRRAEAVKTYGHALKLLEPYGTPEHLELRYGILNELTQALWQENRLREASRYLARMHALLERMPDARLHEKHELEHVAAMIRVGQGRHADALQHARRAYDLAYKLYGFRSGVTAGTEGLMAYALGEDSRPGRALVHRQRYYAIVEAMNTTDGPGMKALGMAAVAAKWGDYPRAIRWAAGALEALPESDGGADERGKAYLWRAYACAKSGQSDRALADFKSGFELTGTLLEQAPDAKAVWSVRYADLLRAVGRTDEAVATLESVRPVLADESQVPVGGLIWMEASELDIRLALDQDDLPGARRRLQASRGALDKHQDRNPLKRAAFQVLEAGLARHEGRGADARRLAEAGSAVLQRELSPNAAILLEAQALAGVPQAEGRGQPTAVH